MFESAWFGAGDGALPSWDPAHDGLVRGLMANVRGMARDGLACGRLGRTEHALTAALSAYIQQYRDGGPLRDAVVLWLPARRDRCFVSHESCGIHHERNTLAQVHFLSLCAGACN